MRCGCGVEKRSKSPATNPQGNLDLKVGGQAGEPNTKALRAKAQPKANWPNLT